MIIETLSHELTENASADCRKSTNSTGNVTDRDHIYLLVNGQFVQMESPWDVYSCIVAEPGDLRVECEVHCNLADTQKSYPSHTFTFYPVERTASETVFSTEAVTK